MTRDTRANLAFLGMNTMFAIGALFSMPIVVFPFLLLMVLHGGLAIGHTRLDQKKTSELEAKTIYHCHEYETRKLELGLAEAGIMEAVEVTTCEDKECPYCISTHKAIETKRAVEAETRAAIQRRSFYDRKNKEAIRAEDERWERGKAKNRDRAKYNFWSQCEYCDDYTYVRPMGGVCQKCDQQTYRNRSRADMFCVDCGEYDFKPHVHYYPSDHQRGRIGTEKRYA